jgi:hypothetical protein
VGLTWDKVTDGGENRHHHMFSDRHHIGTRHLGYGDLAFVGSVQILRPRGMIRVKLLSRDGHAIEDTGCTYDMVRTNPSGHGKLQLLRRIHDLPGQVPGMERCSDENIRIDDVFPKLASASLLVRGGDELVALVGEPFGDPELVLGGPQESRLFFGRLAAVVEDEEDLHTFR